MNDIFPFTHTYGFDGFWLRNEVVPSFVFGIKYGVTGVEQAIREP